MAKTEEMASEQRQKTARERFEKAWSTRHKDDWAALWMFKKTCKKSWEALGFTRKEIDSIKFYKPDWI